MADADLGYKWEVRSPPEGASQEELILWLLQELQNASNVINNLAEGKCALSKRPPAKPRNGMIRMADGTNWNPGSGRGYYGYDENVAAPASKWKFLG